MKKFFKKVGKVIEETLMTIAAVLVAVSIFLIPVAIAMLLLGGVLKLFGVM